MYHVTRCPNCRTSFRLTDSHLSAFGGKVRCGRCAFVFDARDHFVGETIDDNGPMTVIAAEPQQRRRPKPETPPPAETPVTVAPTPAEAPAGPTPAQQSLQKLADTLAKREGRPVKREPMLELNIDIGHVVSPPPEPPPPPPPPPPSPEPTPAPPFQIDHAVEEIVIEVPKEPDAESPTPDAPTPTADAPAPDSPWPEAAENAPQEHEGYHPILTAEDEALIRGPVRLSPWRWLWTIPITFAGLGLAGQLIYHYRVEMAVQLPGLKPQLERFCARTGCVVEQPARAQYLRTEWSELNFLPEHPELIQLNATLRNQAPFEQELPLLELTLTDEQERILSKKVFGPRDYLAPLADGTPSPLPPALTANGDLRVFLRLDVGDQKSTGYLLTWFYPQAR